jgi:hypothetical protein
MRQLPTKTEIRIEMIVQNVHLKSHLQFMKKTVQCFITFYHFYHTFESTNQFNDLEAMSNCSIQP